MTPEWKLFINFCPKSAFQPRFTCRGQTWQKSAVAKLPKSHLVLLTKKYSGVGDTFEPQFRPHLANRALNFVNVVGPWAVHVYRLWSGSAAICRTYSGKSPKKWIQYRFQPTITNKSVADSGVGRGNMAVSKNSTMIESGMRRQAQRTCSMTVWHGWTWPGATLTLIALETQIDKALNNYGKERHYFHWISAEKIY